MQTITIKARDEEQRVEEIEKFAVKIGKKSPSSIVHFLVEEQDGTTAEWACDTSFKTDEGRLALVKIEA